MNRVGFQEISKIRRREASILLNAGHYQGAYYLVGYAVECALKACVAKQTKRHDFPDKKFAEEVYTHDLEKLVKKAGLAPDFDRDKNSDPLLAVNWAVVKDWKETARYDLGITVVQARDLFSACTARRSGILTWIRRRW